MASSPHFDAENPPTQLGTDKSAKFGPRQLNIVWGNDARYWKMPPKVGSEPGGAAELLQVCWLEVSGKITCAEKGKKYNISFCTSLKADAFGWNNCPVYVMAKFGKKGKYFWKKMTLPAPDQRESKIDLEIECKDDNEENKTIYFGLYEVWSGKWKGGLLLHNAIVKQV